MLTGEQVWQRVLAFAEEAQRTRRRVFTLQRKVGNIITDVKPGSVGRQSDEGKTNRSRVTRGMVLATWGAILRGDSRDAPGTLYFTSALMQAALEDVVEYVGDGRLALKGDLRIAERDRRWIAAAERETRRGPGGAGGEGALHRALKEFIYNDPDKALSPLGSGPYRKLRMEHIFPTADRVDVVLLDRDGNVLLVEVKPELFEDDLAPWAQAAKYRALWSVIEDRPLHEIRCIVAAPNVPDGVSGRMLKRHNIEAVKVTIPK